MSENYKNSPIRVNLLSICKIYLFVYKKVVKISRFSGEMAARVITDMFFGFWDYYFGGQGVIMKKRWIKSQEWRQR